MFYLFVTFLYSFRTPFYFNPLEDRRQFLNYYDFICDCLACTNNYDQFMENSTIGVSSVAGMLKALEDNNKFINENIKKHPCFETCTKIRNNFYLMQQLTFKANHLPFILMKDLFRDATQNLE
jgi:hypothetical protein